ncbi:hypothetical protein FRC00_006904, partial [Tulasnella sp. 408]
FFAVPTSPNINGQLAAPASMPNMFFISTIFMMRTYALYERSRLVLVLLGVTYVLCFAPGFIYFYMVSGRGLDAEALATIANVNGMKKFLVAHGVDLDQGWWAIQTCISVGVPRQLGAIMVSALVYERTLIGAAVGCYYNSTSRAFVACVLKNTLPAASLPHRSLPYLSLNFRSRYFVGMKSILCSRMILRLRWYSNSSEAQSPTFGGQEEALATGTDIFFAEAGPASGDNWMKNADFGIEIPPGSVLSHGASGDDYAVMAMIPVRTRGLPAGAEDDSDLELGHPFREASQAAEEDSEKTLRSTPSASVGTETLTPSRTGFSIRSQEGVAGPSRTRDATSSLPPEG